jgi:hypothetical protein
MAYKLGGPGMHSIRKAQNQHQGGRSFRLRGISRRGFLRGTLAGFCYSLFHPLYGSGEVNGGSLSSLFWVTNIPNLPFYGSGEGNYHAGVDFLLQVMGEHGLKFYRSAHETDLSGPSGLIDPNDVVLIKVNAQWKYRGCTNSDLIRGLVQRLLDHPDGFEGEVVIFENGQGRGSLNCDTTGGVYSDPGVHANANDEQHSFLYLVDHIFNDPRVSSYLLDPIRATFIGTTDHTTDGYRIDENVSYPCFTTAAGNRVELMEGIWNGVTHRQNLKLINVPVLKYHDEGGSEITASLKHVYGILSMSDGQSPYRHYSGLGETCGKMMVTVRTPVLNILDAIWVSHASITGYPEDTTYRANQILASQDPVALDYWASKYILYPISNNPRHLPSFSGIDQWLTAARDTINGRGGLYRPEAGIVVGQVTKDEEEMLVHAVTGIRLLAPNGGEVLPSGSTFSISWGAPPQAEGFDLLYSMDRGRTWESIAQGLTSTTHDWTVPVPGNNTSTCLVRVIGFNSEGMTLGSDRSNAPFTIEVVRVTSPERGETLISGDVKEITWITHETIRPVASVEILLSQDRETRWRSLAKLAGNPGIFRWSVPSVARNAVGKIKVVLMDTEGNVVGSDVSDGFFVIRRRSHALRM